MKTMRSILGAIRKADQKFDFFHEKDRILVGVSGGKDSMVLALALNEYKHFNCVNFEIVPAILDLGFDGFDSTEIVEFFKKHDMELHVIDSRDVYPILKAQQKGAPHLPCSICSRMKKAAINKAAHDLGCNKVAFAHHGDDAVETLFMNEIFGGRVATFQPKMFLERTGLEFIRPLILVHESEVIRAQKEENIPSFPSHCPNDGNTMRAEMKSLLKDIYKKYPSAKDNFFTMMENYEKEMLYYSDIFYKIERKDLSFKPVIQENDSRLEMELRNKTNRLNFESGYRRFLIYKKDKAIGFMRLKADNPNEITIFDLVLLRESKINRENIVKGLESQLSHLINPLKLKIYSKDHKMFYKEHGYKIENKYLVKTL